MASKLLGHIELPESLKPGGFDHAPSSRKHMVRAFTLIQPERRLLLRIQPGQAAGRSSFYRTQNE
jgi:hypothetical protein